MQALLDKTRRMNRLFFMAATEADFHACARIIRDSVGCNAYVLDKGGHILGSALSEDFECKLALDERQFPPEFNEKLLGYLETTANVRLSFEDFDHNSTILPMFVGGERLGTLVLMRPEKQFDTPELILAEHAVTVAAMEILRHNQEAVEEEARRKTAVQVALGTLSFSELNAMRHIFEALGGMEGYLVASRVADKAGITRSVIVNALRKFESAGVIESRSLGMKGTYIRVLNPKLLEELGKLR